MNEVGIRRENLTRFPFYIFITILLGGIGIFGFIANWKADQPTLAKLSTILVAAHLGLYWLNLRQLHRLRWWIFYYIAQTVLIVVIASLPYSGDANLFGLSFLGSATISIIGESLGLWGNTRRAFFLGLLYLGISLGIFFIKVELDFVFPYLLQLLVNGGFIVIIMIIFNQQLKERQKAEDLAEILESANAKLASYAARNESLTLHAERERMARELHDTLTQGVAGLILQLEAIKAYQQQSDHSQAGKILTQALGRARNTLSESRTTIEDLRNKDADFQKIIEKLVEQFDAVGKTDCELVIQLETEKPIPQHIQHHARRVLHEALVNIQKHAQAEAASVSVIQSGNALKLSIHDNGVGFDPQQVPMCGHFGLQGFQERAQLTNSRYTLVSAPDEGTTIEFIFPLDETGDRT
ncbi:MAG: sensor histidine kinase [Anaerolineaceae bacterium]|nr:sensor histidine kinase [Anaerolineaceae bacterium]